jgi:hypothetical protein
MKFMLSFTLTPNKAQRDEAIQRFLKTGGMPPKGVTLLGRWTAADFSHGFDLIESDDAKPLTRFALEWSDLIEQHITPVLEDQELAEVLRASGR